MKFFERGEETMFTVSKILEKHKKSDKIAIIHGNHKLSYKNWHIFAGALAIEIKDKTSKKNVAILMGNSIEFAVALFGGIYAGKTVIPLDIRLTQSEILETIQFCDVDLILCVVNDVLRLGALFEEKRETLKLLGVDLKKLNCFELGMCEKRGQEDIALIFKTSGTTNKSKYVMLSHLNIMFNITNNINALELSRNENSFVVLPMCFAYCIVAQVLSHAKLGGTLVIAEEMLWFKNFVINALKGNVTNMFCTPSVIMMLHSFMKKKGNKHFPAKVCIGGDKITEKNLLELIEEYPQTEFIVTFGLTEAGPRVSTLRGDMIKKKPQSVGLPFNSVEIKVVDENGREIGENQIGELIIKSKSVMKGYYKADALTAMTIKEGWLYTGDLAYVDSDCYLYIVGRKKNVIIVEGRNIFPEEVEEKIKGCEVVEDALVYEKKDKQYGEQVVAKIVIRGGEKNLKKIIEYCKNNMNSYNIPTMWECVESVEKTLTGKIRRI